MKISKLHYISQEPHLPSIRKACQAGCRWIQLRMKDQEDEVYEQLAYQAKEICDQYNALLIINDHVGIVQKISSRGVHLGKQDMPVAEARKLLGSDCIIGGTANTFEDIEQLYQAGADYIGLGPFRFTHTKKNLSPILGPEGYKALMERCATRGIQTPVIAIGGILPEDVAGLLQAGIYGIAVSSVITHEAAPSTVVNHFLTALNHAETSDCR